MGETRQGTSCPLAGKAAGTHAILFVRKGIFHPALAVPRGRLRNRAYVRARAWRGGAITALSTDLRINAGRRNNGYVNLRVYDRVTMIAALYFVHSRSRHARRTSSAEPMIPY